MEGVGVSGIIGYAAEHTPISRHGRLSRGPGHGPDDGEAKAGAGTENQQLQPLDEQPEPRNSGPQAPDRAQAMRALEMVINTLPSIAQHKVLDVHRPMRSLVAGVLAAAYV